MIFLCRIVIILSTYVNSGISFAGMFLKFMTPPPFTATQNINSVVWLPHLYLFMLVFWPWLTISHILITWMLDKLLIFLWEIRCSSVYRTLISRISENTTFHSQGFSVNLFRNSLLLTKLLPVILLKTSWSKA